jgi:four helix bundle protein
MPFEKLEDLRIYKESKLLVEIINNLLKDVKGLFKLLDQIERSSQSVMENIAEMYGAYYYKVKKNSLRIARKEAYETIAHVQQLYIKDVINSTISDNLIKRYKVLIRSINAYIKYLDKKDKDSNG